MYVANRLGFSQVCLVTCPCFTFAGLEQAKSVYECRCLSTPCHLATTPPRLHTSHNQSPSGTSWVGAHAMSPGCESPCTVASGCFSTTAFETSPPSCLSPPLHPDARARDRSPPSSSRRAQPRGEPARESGALSCREYDVADHKVLWASDVVVWASQRFAHLQTCGWASFRFASTVRAR